MVLVMFIESSSISRAIYYLKKSSADNKNDPWWIVKDKFFYPYNLCVVEKQEKIVLHEKDHTSRLHYFY